MGGGVGRKRETIFQVYLGSAVAHEVDFRSDSDTRGGELEGHTDGCAEKHQNDGQGKHLLVSDGSVAIVPGIGYHRCNVWVGGLRSFFLFQVRVRERLES